MPTSERFKIDGTPPDCRDPETFDWQPMIPFEVTYQGKIPRHMRWRCILRWSLMSDVDYGNLMDAWRALRDTVGYRPALVNLPPLDGDDNDVWPAYTGPDLHGNRVRMLMPVATREVMQGTSVEVMFEDIDPEVDTSP